MQMQTHDSKEVMALAVMLGLVLWSQKHFLAKTPNALAHSTAGTFLVFFDSGFILFMLLGSITTLIGSSVISIVKHDKFFILLSCVTWIINIVGEVLVPSGPLRIVILVHLLFHDLVQISIFSQSSPHPFFELVTDKSTKSQSAIAVVCFMSLACFHLGQLLLERSLINST